MPDTVYTVPPGGDTPYTGRGGAYGYQGMLPLVRSAGTCIPESLYPPYSWHTGEFPGVLVNMVLSMNLYSGYFPPPYGYSPLPVQGYLLIPSLLPVSVLQGLIPRVGVPVVQGVQAGVPVVEAVLYIHPYQSIPLYTGIGGGTGTGYDSVVALYTCIPLYIPPPACTPL